MQTEAAEQPTRRSRTRRSERIRQTIRDASTAFSTIDWDYVLDTLELAFWLFVLTTTLVIPITLIYVFSETTMSETYVPILCILFHYGAMLCFYHNKWACAYVEPSSLISFDDIKMYWDTFSTTKTMIAIAAVEIGTPITVLSFICWANDLTWEPFVLLFILMLVIRYCLAVFPEQEAKIRAKKAREQQIATHRAQCNGNCAQCREYDREQLKKELKSEHEHIFEVMVVFSLLICLFLR